MSEFHDPFVPHQVDESIEQLIETNQPDTPLHGQMNSDARLIHSLQKYYSPEQQRYLQALQRVEDRLIKRVIPQNELSSTRPQPSLRQQQASIWWRTQQKGREQQMQERQPSMSRLATVSRYTLILVVILLLVGSLTFILTYVQERNSGFAGNLIKSSPTPAPPISSPTPTIPLSTPIPGSHIGTTLYTTTANSTGYNGASWSPNSKRIASSTVDGVQIWDAVDGQHLVNVPLAAPGEWPYALAWSPKSQLVAIGTNQEVLVVDSQTGQIVHKYTTTITASVKPIVPIPSSSYLGEHFSDSGGQGFRTLAWSPDGKSIALGLSFGATGEARIWNPDNNTIEFTLNLDAHYNIANLAWSSDGQYLAADTWNTQPTDSRQIMNTVLAWEVSTKKVVFQHADSMTSSDAPVFWQPQSHHLSFSGGALSGPTILEVWDALTGAQIKQYPEAGIGTFGWSPDGKYLAYASYQTTGGSYDVTIMDTNTEKQIFVYREHKNNVSFIAWSPNGKYILSAEGDNSGAMLVKVWVAE